MRIVIVILITVTMSIPAIVAAQMGKIEEVKGVLILPNRETIPQDVIFLSLKKINEEPILSIFERALAENNSNGTIIYFQALRWNNADLLKNISKSKHITALITNQEALRLIYLPDDSVRILTGIIAFERVPLHLASDEKCEDVKLVIAKKEYSIRIADMPANTGYPIYFKPILEN